VVPFTALNQRFVRQMASDKGQESSSWISQSHSNLYRKSSIWLKKVIKKGEEKKNTFNVCISVE
jgi:hypothetical protein